MKAFTIAVHLLVPLIVFAIGFGAGMWAERELVLRHYERLHWMHSRTLLNFVAQLMAKRHWRNRED